MLFRDYYFILSLPMLIGLVRNLKGRGKERMLAGLSLFFYVYYGWESLVMVLSITGISYFFGIVIESKRDGKRKILWLGLSFILFLMVFLKAFLGYHFIGLSYYGLMAISYLIRLANGKKAICEPLSLLVCLSFFPLMLQGPITDVYSIRQELQKTGAPLSERDFFKHFNRILLGYFKIFIVADRLSPYIRLLFLEKDNEGISFVVSLLFYSINLIMDFTGGIDIVLGISGLMGISLSENFSKPLRAKTLSDFWKRWHISLSAWFSTFVFYPLSLWLSKQKWLRRFPRKTKQKIQVYFASIVTWSLTGLWHGLNFSFLCWGLLNALILIVSYENKTFFKRFRERKSFLKGRFYSFLQMLRTFFVVSLLRGFDQYENPGKVVRKIFSLKWEPHILIEKYTEAGLGLSHGVVLFLAILWIFHLSERCEKESSYLSKLTLSLSYLILILVFGAYGKGFELSSFIYSRF